MIHPLVLLSVALYSPKDFSPAAVPPEYSFGADVYAPRHDAHVLASSERIGEGLLPGPDDLAYDAAGGWLYTGCADGWIRRVSGPAGTLRTGPTLAAARSASCAPVTAASPWRTQIR